jgi:hypothetical protein
MSNISITSLFPFRRVKFVGYEQIEFDNGSGIVVELSPDKRF